MGSCCLAFSGAVQGGDGLGFVQVLAGPAWLPCAVAVSASLPLATPCPPSASGTPWATGSRAWPSACTGTSARSRTTSPWRRRSSECPPPAGLLAVPCGRILHLCLDLGARSAGTASWLWFMSLRCCGWEGLCSFLPIWERKARMVLIQSEISFPMSRSESGSFLTAIKNHICRFDCNLWLTSSMVGWM